jgi:hypothetical protein
MIFGYMISNIGEDQPVSCDAHGIPWPTLSPWNSQGLSIIEAKSHLTNSPWILLNKVYRAEYLQVFVKEVRLSASFTCDWTRPYSRSSFSDTEEPPNLTEPNQVLKVLQLITHRFNITAPDAGLHASSTNLLSRIKSISLSYEYYGSFFERGFGKTDRRRFPCKGFLTSPLKLLRQYHDEYNIPAGRLSININYGDPTWTIMACINRMDFERCVFGPFFSLTPIEAAIHVNDHDASVTAIDKKLEILEDDVQSILEKLRIKYPGRHSHLS